MVIPEDRPQNKKSPKENIASVIQWNCRGLRPNFYELSILIVKYNPLAVCLQETFQKDTDNITVRGQLCLNKLQQWATDNGFQFSKTKTVCMHICQKRGFHLHPQLFLDKRPIPVEETTMFLGVIFDRKLSFVPHLKYI